MKNAAFPDQIGGCEKSSIIPMTQKRWMGENGEWVKINLGFLRKPLQFSIHHSSFIIFSISTSSKFLRSPFFQTAKLLRVWNFVYPCFCIRFFRWWHGKPPGSEEAVQGDGAWLPNFTKFMFQCLFWNVLLESSEKVAAASSRCDAARCRVNYLGQNREI